jgi:hypothetical protein
LIFAAGSFGGLVKALETRRNQDKAGELNLSGADRFWVKIDGDASANVEILRNVARQMDLKKLATPAERDLSTLKPSGGRDAAAPGAEMAPGSPYRLPEDTGVAHH